MLGFDALAHKLLGDLDDHVRRVLSFDPDAKASRAEGLTEEQIAFYEKYNASFANSGPRLPDAQEVRSEPPPTTIRPR